MTGSRLASHGDLIPIATGGGGKSNNQVDTLSPVAGELRLSGLGTIHQFSCPRAPRIHHHFGPDLKIPAGSLVSGFNAGYRPALDQEPPCTHIAGRRRPHCEGR